MPGGTARDVMNPQVLAVRIDMTVQELAAFLTENQITGAPVVDRDGHLVGVVSLADIAESNGNQGDFVADVADPRLAVRDWDDKFDAADVRPYHVEADPRLVRDIMTPTVYTIPEDTPVARIARTMIAGRIHRLFVTRKKRVVGIVTSLDLLKLLCEDQ